MQIPKPTEADLARFRSLVPEDPTVSIRPMFGNVGAFVNGTMFMGLFGPDVGIRLAPTDAEQLRLVEGAGPFGPSERPMGGYVTLPPSLDHAEGERWVARSLEFVGSLPPKAKK